MFRKRILYCSMNERILELYEQGYTKDHISKELGLGHREVLSFLKEQGIPIRNLYEARLSNQLRKETSLKLTPSFFEYLDGLLISDGYIFERKHSGLYKQSTVSEDWLSEICDVFSESCLEWSVGQDKRKQYSTTCWCFTTRSYTFLKQMRKKWYPNGVKSVPLDLTLSPLVVRNWILGDGNRYGSGIRLCCESFTPEDNALLLKKLSQLGINGHLSKGNRLVFSRDESEKLLSYSLKGGQPPLDFQYKWKIGRGRKEISLC